MPAIVDKFQTFRAYRSHRHDPEAFYRPLAAEAARRLDDRLGVSGKRLLDLGCGPGYYLEALRDLGAEVIGVEMSETELRDRPTPVTGAIVGDGTLLPFPEASFDGVVCSNMLEHTPTPERVLEEIARVVRPGGWAYVSWTPWFSPWGGHDMNPYHLLGPQVGPRLYERLHGPPRKNRYGDGLWPTHIGRVLRDLGAVRTLRLDATECRYWPRLSWLTRVPVVREVTVGNCVLYLHRL